MPEPIATPKPHPGPDQPAQEVPGADCGRVDRWWALTWPRRVGLLLAAAAVVWLCRFLAPAATSPYVREFPVMGTYGRLTFHAPPAAAAAAADEIVARLQALERCINRFDPASELSRLNAAAADAPVPCSPELWEILLAARRAWQATGGVFDVTVGPLMQVWGFHRARDTWPSADELAAAHERVGFAKLELDEERRTLRFTRPGMALDFGGLAKGYGLDLAAPIARRHGLTRGVIDLGGNVLCLDEPPPGKTAYMVGIRDPAAPERLLTRVTLRAAAVATSGDYERRGTLAGRAVSHIMDPHSGQPAHALAAVSVVTLRGVDSDAFSTAVFVAGPELAARLVERCPGTRVLLVESGPDGRSRLRWLPADAAP